MGVSIDTAPQWLEKISPPVSANTRGYNSNETNHKI